MQSWCDLSAIGVILGCDLKANLAGAWRAWLGWAVGAWRQTMYGDEVGAWVGAEIRLVRV